MRDRINILLTEILTDLSQLWRACAWRFGRCRVETNVEQWRLTLKNFHLRFSQHNSTTLVYNTLRPSLLIEMSDVLEPLKTAVFDHSKCVPDMHMGECQDHARARLR